ncbi:hypothetical protein PR202_gb21190 [Eleusine coracana subsp. coracana]|uniref:Uncharacterized protein n=1 Tax=Eleusine coracana subsp. coracana TaxID=191504 RepID=A0AAV5FEJ1_ELECO|nr:hypothetical protein QOZ80_7BG0603370 [Eleusine coracana subsp. coracana]GJN32670.1 hypothetical protein PR202_gb21190 [Eleusine coracana subsp. coracana]
MASPAAAGDAGLAYPLLVKRDGTGREEKGYWEPTGEEEALAAECADNARPPPLYRTFKVKDSLLLPYRLLNLARLLLIINFFAWRLKHRESDSMVLWWITLVGDFWFGLSWLLNQASKLNPIKRVPDVSLLNQHLDQSQLPGVDVFINTVDPIDEPVLCTMNSVLSILATDYPAGKHATYFSDDGASLVHYEALLETARFAALWTPFCRKHRVEPRAPESYFSAEKAKAAEGPYAGSAPGQFIEDRRRVRREYEEFKARVEKLFADIPRRSEVFNKGGGERATYMADGRIWPGTWVEPAENHRKGQHAAVVEVVLNHPGDEPQLGTPGRSSEESSPLDFSAVDVRLPMLVYIAREKRPGYDHQKKAGAMNAQLRVSGLLTNAPFIINFDGDHYVNNSSAFRAAACFFLDARHGEDTAFVQFPQRFDGVDPTDRYCNHNRVFFDATLLGLNGLQGPSYVGTGCMFRRAALYGADPPRWQPAQDDDTNKATTLAVDPCRQFGTSMAFINSVPLAANHQDRPIMAAELDYVSTCAYEDGTEWGRGVGWVYNIATEDVVTGFRLHRKGWRSMYCSTQPDAFRGTAPINLTERLYQILRWSGGSLDMFLSRNCPLLAGRRLHPMQRLAYTNMTVYPVCAAFIFAFDLLPLMWLLGGHHQFYVQKPFRTYAEYLFASIVMMELSGMLEIKWAGLGVLDWVRNEQFFMVGATGVYPAAVLHSLLRLVGLKGLPFKLTSKPTAAIAREPFAEMYDVQWAPLLAPTLVVMAVNAAAIAVVIGKAVAFGWPVARLAGAAGGLLFNAWVLLLLYPFALGLMGRWSRRPYLFFLLLVAVLVAAAAVYVAMLAVLPPGGAVPQSFRVLHAVSPARWRTY